nr:uncharacterized protein LOC109169324 [Ipomoea batatas]
MNGSTWYSDRSSQRLGGGIHEVEQISALSAKVDNVATMVQKLAQITLQNQNVSYVSTPHSPSRQVLICDLCGGGHNLGECLNDDTNSQSSVEHINLVGYNRPQQPFQPQGAYDPNNSRNHPGFSWSNPNGAANPQSYGNRNPPPGFQGQQNFRGGPTQQFRSTQGFQPQAPTIQPSPPLPTLEAPPPPNWEAMMQMMLKSQLQSEERYKQMSEKIDQLSAHNKMLERQIANQASTSSTKVTGKLPACPEIPKEHVNAIITRSGKKHEEPPLPVEKPRPSKIIDVEIEEKLEEEEATPPILNASPQSHEKDEKGKPERKCYRADVMGGKTRDGDANFTHLEKVDKGCLLGCKACVGNFNEASDGALERFQTWISTRDFKKERGLEYVVPERWNWGPLLLAQPGVAFAAVVREFYANAKVGPRNNVCIVRGVEVNFSPQAINAYYGTRSYNGEDYYHNELMHGRITVGALNEIARTFHRDAEWNVRGETIAHMNYAYFTPQDRGILDFIKAKLIPHSHRGSVRRDQVLLAYCIKERQTIDVGALINRSIRDIASSDKKSRCPLGHPFLITELCRLAGVPMDPHLEIKVHPQCFLSQQYIQSRYGHGQMPVNDPDDEENEEQAHDEAMEDPAPAAHAPNQFPPQYNMEQYFARQEEFMRRQEEFMTRHEGYMRRNDDINWFVGTSAHQHNLAAQGFTPQFPPPPPWLQDPQFIPAYYSSQFPPPPPPEGNHQ